MHNVHQKSSSARNWWLSLLPELTVLKSEPVKTKVSEVGGGKLRFTIWDQVNPRHAPFKIGLVPHQAYL